LSAGSLDENKGHSDLLYAFARSFKQKNNVQLIIVGEGPLGQKLKSLSHELGINQQVTFLGKIDHEGMLAEMSACDALVLSSRYETFGVVVIEALACGKPVVATRCGGPEWIVHEGNGLLVPVRDIAALGHAMLAIKNSAHRFDSRQIRQDCIARFGEKTVIRLLSEVYSQILAEWRT
jgi:glycosyltransferase involved in cell wall biosynthesis